MKQKLTGVIVGAGHRARLYSSYAQEHPAEMQIVGVADPSPLRRQQVAEELGLSAQHCFESAEDLAQAPKFADFVINGTMDHQHVPTSLPLLAVGYDLLLEKPFAVNEREMWELVRAARQHRRTIVICHVLRYAPFYAAIRQQILAGTIGDILNIQATEHVSYHHVAVAYVRGKWNHTRDGSSSMLMAKSCHDLDLIAWMKSGVAPRRVSSFGNLFQFTSEKAPHGAGTRCLVDCPIEPDCLYSARKHYLDHPDRWSFYVWDALEHLPHPTLEQKIALLKGDSPYGRCVWRCNNTVVDHQSVLIEFADGCTATLNMIGGCSKPSRALHLIGTTGEIQGCLEDSRFVIRHIDPRPGHEYREELVDLNVGGDMTGAFGAHAGGDMRLVSDFLKTLRGEPRSICSTVIEDSVAGHLMGFSADQSLCEQRIVNLDFQKWLQPET